MRRRGTDSLPRLPPLGDQSYGASLGGRDGAASRGSRTGDQDLDALGGVWSLAAQSGPANGLVRAPARSRGRRQSNDSREITGTIAEAPSGIIAKKLLTPRTGNRVRARGWRPDLPAHRYTQ